MKKTLEDFEILRTIGTGSFGIVKLAKEKATDRYFAIKSLSKSSIIQQKQVDHVMSEFMILRQIEHPLLVYLDSYFQNDSTIRFVTEYVQGGELFTYLRSVGRLSNDHAKFYAAQVVVMLEYLHSKSIIYRDLKPENLLIGADGYLKLTDFGFAKVVVDRTYTICGTPEYIAPEILLNKGHGKPVDWWSLGVLIYELLVGIDPFTAEYPMQIYENIIRCKVKFPKNIDSQGRRLVRHLLTKDLSKRFGNLKGGVNDIKFHKWFSGINWQKIIMGEAKAPYVPTIAGPDDCTNFEYIEEVEELNVPVDPSVDPFLEW